MIISDLNYVENTANEVVGAGFFFDKYINQNINTNLGFNSNTNINSNSHSNSSTVSQAYVSGNAAKFAFDNEAVGYNSYTEGAVNQLTVAGGGSSQNGQFVSAATPGYYYHY